VPHHLLTTTPRASAIVACAVIAMSTPGGNAAGARLNQTASASDLVTVELSTVGFDRVTGSPVVLLRDPESGRVVPIWVGVAEAQAIARALHGVTVPRPMTHDLMATLLSELKAEVDEVVVHDLRENTYYGLVRLRVAGEKTTRDVDSRPSDALALALRTGATIRVARKLLLAPPDFDFVAPDAPTQVAQVLGITVVAVTPALRQEFALPDQPGVVITSVYGRARDEGLRRGDLILEVNGNPVRDPVAFFQAVRGVPSGARITIRYWRNGDIHDVELPSDLPPARPPRGKSLTV
jgi:bifunctional DNase/RNase